MLYCTTVSVPRMRFTLGAELVRCGGFQFLVSNWALPSTRTSNLLLNPITGTENLTQLDISVMLRWPKKIGKKEAKRAFKWKIKLKEKRRLVVKLILANSLQISSVAGVRLFWWDSKAAPLVISQSRSLWQILFFFFEWMKDFYSCSSIITLRHQIIV